MAVAERETVDGGRIAGYVWPLTVALIMVAPSQFSYALDPKDGPFILYADLFAAAVFGVWLISVLARRRWNEIVLPPAAIWALLVVAALSALGATSLRSAAVEIAQIVLYFVAVYALFANVLYGQHRLVVATKALAIATTVVIGFALVQYFSADDAMDVRGTFGNRNVYSAYLAMVLPLLYGMAIWVRDTVHRVWFLALLVLGAFTMLAGLHLWVLALVLLVISALKGLRAVGYYLLGATVFVAIVVLALPMNRQALFTELADPFERGEVHKIITMPGEEPPPLVKKRWLEWQPALTMMSDNFLLGVGAGNYQKHIGEGTYYGFLPNVKKTEPDTNNLYLVIGSSMGFAGLVAFLAWIGRTWAMAETGWERARDHWSMGLSWGLLGSVYAIMLINLFSSLFVRGTSLVWALVFAMVASVHYRGFAGEGVQQAGPRSSEDNAGED